MSYGEDRRDAVTILAQMCDRLTKMMEDAHKNAQWQAEYRQSIARRLDEIEQRLDQIAPRQESTS